MTDTDLSWLLPALVAVTAPTVNSYRRLQPRFWSSAYTAWGPDNKEGALRLPSPPRGTEAEQEARSDAIEAAMHGATDVPVYSARSAAAVLDLAVEAARITNPIALGDVAVATHLALGSTRGAADQARMNLSTMKDAAFVSQTGGQIDGLLAQANTAAQQALADIQTRVPAG